MNTYIIVMSIIEFVGIISGILWACLYSKYEKKKDIKNNR